jgi:putative nucleotidyltransferase with HDIG domain
MESITDFLSKPCQRFDRKTPVSEAIAHMRRENLGAILVYEDGKPRGIFTERDILMKFDFTDPAAIGALRLGDVMSSDLVTAGPDTSFKDALVLMQGKGIRNLPIMSDGEVLGIVSLRKILNHYSTHLERLLDETVDALTSAIGQRDPYTADHERRVAAMSVAIAGRLGLESALVNGLRLAALTHDIGKIDVPIELLCKPGRLSPAEFELIKQHPQAGYQILSTVDFERPVAEMVLQHHERLDGSGYPRALRGDEICLEARIMAVADVFEAIMSFRPYRAALGIEKARKEIVEKRGEHFDPLVVDAFVALLDDPSSGVLDDY